MFAAECLRKIVSEYCYGDRAHYDLGTLPSMMVVLLLSRQDHPNNLPLTLGLAREIVQLKKNDGLSDYLVLHLSELVRMAFMAATSDSDNLRLEGRIVTRFRHHFLYKSH